MLGPSLLRIGGNSVDQTTWTPTGPGQTSGETAPSDVNALASFVAAAGWPVLYGLNLAQSTPAVAAAEVAYAAEALGTNLFGIEIGNEAGPLSRPLLPFDLDLCRLSRALAEFRLRHPGANPRRSAHRARIADNTSWFSSFAQAEGKNVVLLSAHYYRGNGQSASSTIQELISYPDTNLENYLATLEAPGSGCRGTVPAGGNQLVLQRWRAQRE